jgi:hypothetical protein
MDTARIRLGSLMALLLASSLGCNKSTRPPVVAPSPVTSPDTITRVHWLGLHPMAYEAGAFTMMRLWDMPETAAVEKQTLDKLSSAPWRWLLGENQVTNLHSLLLRPLLDDVVRDECYLELRHPRNQPEELVFAIRLDDPRVGLWETNLANVFQSLTGTWPIAAGHHSWTLRRDQNPNLIEMSREGQWTLLGVAPKDNLLLREIIGRIRHDPAPFGVMPRNEWLEVEADLERLAGDPSQNLDHAPNIPKVSLLIGGDGAHVIEHGELTFPEPLPIQFEPWTIPGNLNGESLNGFTAVRGFKPWLESLNAWTNLHVGSPPNQLCLWSPQSSPLQTYFCAPDNGRATGRANGRADLPVGQDAQQRVPTDLGRADLPVGPGASSLVARLTGLLVREANPWLASHGMGSFSQLSGSDGAIWVGLPLISPYIKSVPAGTNDMVIGATLSNPGTQTNPPSALYYHPNSAELLRDLETETNLVYFDWELTGPRIESSLDIGQALRLGLGYRQLPLDSASLGWLYAIRYRLGNSTTRIARTSPNQLIFDRKSSIGLTAAELNLLADWLESPNFPRGLYSLPPPPR